MYFTMFNVLVSYNYAILICIEWGMHRRWWQRQYSHRVNFNYVTFKHIIIKHLYFCLCVPSIISPFSTNPPQCKFLLKLTPPPQEKNLQTVISARSHFASLYIVLCVSVYISASPAVLFSLPSHHKKPHKQNVFVGK